jgi:putative membrane protein
VVRVAWRLRWDLLAVLVVAAVMALLTDRLPMKSVAPVVPLLGIVASIFIGFRNSNAYARWWEARTLWGGTVGNARSLSNALVALDNQSAEMAEVADRMRRRQARHNWQLAAELRGETAASAVSDLTPEDPADASSGDLLARQGADIGLLTRTGMIDVQGRTLLVNANTAQANAAGGLERIRHQPIPRYYDLFVRGLTWFFAVTVCIVDAGGHGRVAGIAGGILLMTLFVVAERIGHLLEEPMSDTALGLPMEGFCSRLTADLLGQDIPLARWPA